MQALVREARSIVRLALPVIATQVGSMTLIVVDNLMLGHYGVEAFGASAIGRVWIMGTALIAMGLLFGLDPLVSQAHGARNAGRLGALVQRGLLLALLLSAPIAGLLLFTERVLIAFGQDPELAAAAHGYALAQIPGLPFYLGYMVLRSWLQGRRILRPALLIVLAANLVNALANWVLIFGKLGIPPMGIVGAGISTSLTEMGMFLGLLCMIRAFRLERGAWEGFVPLRRLVRGMGGILRIGAPVGAQLGLEMWAFQIATLWAGTLGIVSLASHNIALNLASLAFMVPLGLSIGASVRVGNLVGARRPDDALRAAWVAVALGTAVMCLFAILFVAAREGLSAIYTRDAAVVAAAAAVLPIAAAFQLFDGAQVVAGGVMRGMGHTRPVALAHLFGFYLIGLPLAYWLAFRLGHGLSGIWWGLCAGLGTVALAVVAWIGLRGPASVRSAASHGG